MSAKIESRPERRHRMFVRVAALLCLPAVAPAQGPAPYRPIRFDRADFEPSLPQSSVYVVHQDRHGFLWFGTREGLGRWDGHEMRTWKAAPFKTNTLPNNVVRRIVEDRDGSLWVMVEPTDYQGSRVARLAGPDHQVIEQIAKTEAVPFVDRDSVAWLVDRDSLYRFDGATRHLAPKRARLRAGFRPRSAMVDRNGTIWIGSDDGVLEKYPTEGAPSVVRPAEPWSPSVEGLVLHDIFEDDRGTVWLTGVGLRQLDSSRTRIVRAPVPAVLDTVGSSSIIQDPDGWLWLATLDGVYRFDRNLAHVERHPMRLPGDIPAQNFVVGLLRDRAGTVWAGTVWGLHRYDPAVDHFVFLGHDPNVPTTLGSGLVLAVFEDPTGAVWVGTLGGGLNRIDRSSGLVSHFRHRPGDPASLPSDWVWAIADAGEGSVWVGTSGGLALVSSDAPNVARRVPLPLPRTLAPQGVYSLHGSATGSLLIGTEGALFRREPNGRVLQVGKLIDGRVERVVADGDDFWVATSGGLLRYQAGPGTWTRHRHDPRDSTTISHDAVLSLHLDGRRRLWIGTSNGLDRLDPGSERFLHVGTERRFPSSVIYSMLESDEGSLWLGTNRGLVRFDPDHGDTSRIRVYGMVDGVGNVEFNRHAAAIGRDGTLYFGGDKGLTYFHPRSLRDNPVAPPIVLTSVARSTRQGTRVTPWVGPDDTIELEPADYTVTFTFAALNYTNPSRNRHAYRLEGLDPQWIEAGAARTASYTNLPAGRYVFRVRGSNDDGVWNETGLAIPVVVRPWFWMTWWFRALLAAAAALVVAAATTFVLRTRHRRQLEVVRHQKALEGERARISRDMHDEVGASLTEIALLSEQALRGDGQGRPQARAPLQRIADRSRATLGAIGEIIWAINPDNDRIEHLSAYLREYAAEFLESAGLQASLDFASPESAGQVTAEFRRNVFLVMKEGLANVAKHAGARRVEVSLGIRTGRLELRIRDDGRGFTLNGGPAAPGDRDGLANMRKRALELGGEVSVESAPDAGTRLVLDVPLPAPFRVGTGAA